MSSVPARVAAVVAGSILQVAVERALTREKGRTLTRHERDWLKDGWMPATLKESER